MHALEFARNFFAELHRRNPVLSWMGWANVALLLFALAAAPFDSRTVTGLNPWIKPMKFAASVAVFVFTMAWLLEHVKRYRRTVRAVSWGIAVVFAVEQACILLQAARGTISHFNVKSPFDAAVFALMGVMIVVNTALVLVVLFLFFRRTEPIAPAYLWGIRLGIIIFVAAGLQGFAMTSQLAHTVGAPDGGPGLPFLGWSTRAGDLRIAHSRPPRPASSPARRLRLLAPHRFGAHAPGRLHLRLCGRLRGGLRAPLLAGDARTPAPRALKSRGGWTATDDRKKISEQ